MSVTLCKSKIKTCDTSVRSLEITEEVPVSLTNRTSSTTTHF